MRRSDYTELNPSRDVSSLVKWFSLAALGLLYTCLLRSQNGENYSSSQRRIRGHEENLLSNLLAVSREDNDSQLFVGHLSDEERAARSMAKQATRRDYASRASPSAQINFVTIPSESSSPSTDATIISTSGTTFDALYNSAPQYVGHLSDDEKLARAAAKQETKKETNVHMTYKIAVPTSNEDKEASLQSSENQAEFEDWNQNISEEVELVISEPMDNTLVSDSEEPSREPANVSVIVDERDQHVENDGEDHLEQDGNAELSGNEIFEKILLEAKNKFAADIHHQQQETSTDTQRAMADSSKNEEIINTAGVQEALPDSDEAMASHTIQEMPGTASSNEEQISNATNKVAETTAEVLYGREDSADTTFQKAEEIQNIPAITPSVGVQEVEVYDVIEIPAEVEGQEVDTSVDVPVPSIWAATAQDAFETQDSLANGLDEVQNPTQNVPESLQNVESGESTPMSAEVEEVAGDISYADASGLSNSTDTLHKNKNEDEIVDKLQNLQVQMQYLKDLVEKVSSQLLPQAPNADFLSERSQKMESQSTTIVSEAAREPKSNLAREQTALQQVETSKGIRAVSPIEEISSVEEELNPRALFENREQNYGDETVFEKTGLQQVELDFTSEQQSTFEKSADVFEETDSVSEEQQSTLGESADVLEKTALQQEVDSVSEELQSTLEESADILEKTGLQQEVDSVSEELQSTLEESADMLEKSGLQQEAYSVSEELQSTLKETAVKKTELQQEVGSPSESFEKFEGSPAFSGKMVEYFAEETGLPQVKSQSTDKVSAGEGEKLLTSLITMFPNTNEKTKQAGLMFPNTGSTSTVQTEHGVGHNPHPTQEEKMERAQNKLEEKRTNKLSDVLK